MITGGIILKKIKIKIFCVVSCTILCYDLKTQVSQKTIVTFASHNNLYMFDFLDVVNLLGSAPGTALPWVKKWELIKELKDSEAY